MNRTRGRFTSSFEKQRLLPPWLGTLGRMPVTKVFTLHCPDCGERRKIKLTFSNPDYSDPTFVEACSQGHGMALGKTEVSAYPFAPITLPRASRCMAMCRAGCLTFPVRSEGMTFLTTIAPGSTCTCTSGNVAGMTVTGAAVADPGAALWRVEIA